MRLTPEHIDAFIVVPVYGFVSDTSRIDVVDTAYLAQFHDSTFDDALAPDSDLRHYLKVFPPDYVLRVSEPLETNFLFDKKLQGSERVVGLFAKSINTAIHLLTCLRLYGKGLLQRGDIWIHIPMTHQETPGQLSLRFSPTGSSRFDWIGREGTPHRVSEQESYRFDMKEIPYFRAFFEQVREVLSRPESPISNRTRVALHYYNRTFGVEEKAMRIVDLVTCLEALLSDQGEELSYRLGLRCANLLGTDSMDRKRIHKEIREFYDVRSHLVHGDELRETHKSRIREVEKLREYVRRALLTLLGVNLGTEFGADIYKTLDEMNLDEDVRKTIQEKGSRLLHLNAQGPQSDKD